MWSTTNSRSRGGLAAHPFKLICAAILAILFLSGLCFARADDTKLQAYEAVEPHMGTLFRIKLYAASEQQANAAFRAAFARIAELDNILSDYKPDSELNRIAATAVHNPMPVSDDLFRVASASQDLARDTDGAFDITLGPVIRLWRQARKKGTVPDANALANASAVCGYGLLKLDAAHKTIELEKPGMQLDVGGIAKGYAADEALVVLEKQGIRSALVAASGDLAFSDAPPGKRGWSVGVDSFDSANAPFTKVLILANAAISTSGNAEQHVDANGKRYSHIIDPKTKLGITEPITVSIVAPRGITADSLATAISVMGASRGLSYVNARPDLAALIVMNNSERTQVEESRRFRELPAAGVP